MLHGDVIAVIGVLVVGLGLVVTWIRNGRNQARYQGVLEADVKHIKDKLDDENTGLSAIKTCVDDQKLHCAKVSSVFAERIKTLERGKK